jgi:peptidoglycan/LPS O-acetylase OafA/YrhL
MSKPLLGLALGALLGLIDGSAAYLYPYPEVKAAIVGIIIGSTFKGVITGVLAGFFAQRLKSVPLGIVFGLVVGLVLSYLVAAMPDPNNRHYYFEIMLPGTALGAIVGFATQQFGRAPGRSPRQPDHSHV